MRRQQPLRKVVATLWWHAVGPIPLDETGCKSRHEDVTEERLQGVVPISFSIYSTGHDQ